MIARRSSAWWTHPIPIDGRSAPSLSKTAPFCRRDDSGFTLLEVMVATAIMAIAVAALLSNLHNSLRNLERLTTTDRAAVFAQHKMDELLADPTLGVLSQVSGVYLLGDDPSQSGWAAKVRPFEYPPEQSSARALLAQVHLEIWWTRNSQRKTYALNGYRTIQLTAEEIEKVRFLMEGRARGLLQ